MEKDYSLEGRKWLIVTLVLLVVTLFAAKLYDLQLGDNNYGDAAASNAYLNRTIYPDRGLIYDREGRLVVYNQPAYDLVIIPKDLKAFDTLDLCQTLQIPIEELRSRIATLKDGRKYSGYVQQVLMRHLTPEVTGRLQEKLFRFPGFYIAQRVLRQYNYTCGANVLGDIREVNQNDIMADDYYRPGDYTGDLGVEKSYEHWLRGVKGKEIFMRDAFGRLQGRFHDGRDDVAPEAGKDLKLSIDFELQKLGEHLMEGKIGAIVAIEPKTGEVLCLVSSPGYDPALLVGRERSKNYSMLLTNHYKPLYDRAIMASYPPGSTFKPTQGLIFLQEGIITTETAYPCSRGFISGGMRVGCHGHGSPLPLKPALATSCNAYFCWGFKRMMDNGHKKYASTRDAFEVWKRHMVSMGYGYRLGIDLPGESRGFIPNSNFYDKMKKGKWNSYSIISDAIGQGEILATPLQIANLGATIANRGYYITPHVVKEIMGVGILKKNRERHDPTIDKHYYDDIAMGMRMAVTGGTCRGANLAGFEVCGKTGTAQNPHGRDHSVFMGFAPMNDPQIAICVYVENAGFGATFAVPIASLVLDQYLNRHNGGLSPARQAAADAMASRHTVPGYTPLFSAPKRPDTATDASPMAASPSKTDSATVKSRDKQ